MSTDVIVAGGSEKSDMLVLEEYEHAEKHGAIILDETVNYASTMDAARAMKVTLAHVQVDPTDSAYINVHRIT